MKLKLANNSRSALLIIDMQPYFFQEAQRRKKIDLVVDNINQLIENFDACSLPVLHVVSCYQADGSDWDLKMKAAGKPALIAGTEEAAILPGIRVLDDHTRVIKTRYSAFFRTNLANLLRAKKIDRVVVVGAYTHYCVNATIFDAYSNDFVPCLITDAVLSHLPDESRMMKDRMRRNGYHLFGTDEFIADMNSN